MRNFTRNFKVVDLKKEKGRVRLKLRNDYDKAITAFSFSPTGPSRYSIEPDFFPEMIAPGQTHEEVFRLPDDSGPERIIIIGAVIFDDETGDGDKGRIARMKDYRLGKRLAATHILPHLQNILNGRDEQLMMRLQGAKLAIRYLPIPAQVQPSSHVEAGFKTAVEHILMNLDEIEADKQKGTEDSFLRHRLDRIKERERRKSLVANR
ncbi:MAG: hypothetical protein AB1631_16215 [Acidobacteriota bacterium]